MRNFSLILFFEWENSKRVCNTTLLHIVHWQIDRIVIFHSISHIIYAMWIPTSYTVRLIHSRFLLILYYLWHSTAVKCSIQWGNKSDILRNGWHCEKCNLQKKTYLSIEHFSNLNTLHANRICVVVELITKVIVNCSNYI